MTFAEMMSAFYAAREDYLGRMESECMGYATEEREWKETHKAPQLRDYMQLRSSMMGA